MMRLALAFIAAAVLTVVGADAAAASGPPQPDSSSFSGSFNVVTNLVCTGHVCHGTAELLEPGETQGGDFTATGTTSTTEFTAFPDGTVVFRNLTTVTGTSALCGSGSITQLIVGKVDSTGQFEATWRILPGFGTGDLKGMTGHGTEQGDIVAGTGTLEGVVHC